MSGESVKLVLDSLPHGAMLSATSRSSTPFSIDAEADSCSTHAGAIVFFVLLVLVVLLDRSAFSATPPDPQREFRAAWIATVYNIDWPSKPGLPASKQRAEMRALLDRAAAMKLNAVIFQVRPSCDAIYPSRKEPWSRFLTGKMGKPAGYDPLAYAISEAHRRGLELHAWFNPFRALASPKEAASSKHVTRRHPAWVRKHEGKIWLDPGLPQVRNYSMDVIMDVVSRYDIDGAHIDDYFYPYPKNPKIRPIPQFPDTVSYKRYGKGKNRDDWRRANMDSFVSSLYRNIKKKKPWVKVGISPFGIWRPGNPSGIVADLDAYSMIYADSRKWFAAGWCDYFTPQLYWRISPRDQSFSALADWWGRQNRSGRHLWPGMATSRIGSSEDPGRPAAEIVRQIGVCRSVIPPGRSGHCHWSFKALRQDRGGIVGQLRDTYRSRAIVPAMPWLSRAVPGRPGVSAEVAGNGIALRWRPGRGSKGLRWWVVQAQAVPGARWEIARVLWHEQTTMELRNRPHAVSVTAIDAYGNAGPAAVLGQ